VIVNTAGTSLSQSSKYWRTSTNEASSSRRSQLPATFVARERDREVAVGVARELIAGRGARPCANRLRRPMNAGILPSPKCPVLTWNSIWRALPRVPSMR
jgi:hypothetical protein